MSNLLAGSIRDYNGGFSAAAGSREHRFDGLIRLAGKLLRYLEPGRITDWADRLCSRLSPPLEGDLCLAESEREVRPETRLTITKIVCGDCNLLGKTPGNPLKTWKTNKNCCQCGCSVYFDAHYYQTMVALNQRQVRDGKKPMPH